MPTESDACPLLPHCPEADPLAAALTPDEQQRVWCWLLKGASPQVACQQLGIDIARFWKTLDQDAPFALALQQLFDTLSHNVLAALYQAAMKGNVAAQQFWLRHRPVSRWVTELEEPAIADDDFARLSDADLLDVAGTEDVALPAAVTARLRPPGS